MKRLGQLWRLIHINYVFLRHGLDEFIFAFRWFRPLKFFYYLAPWNWFRKHKTSRAERVRCALEDLGPIFVKFGQMLSTRRDLLPPEYAVELAKLQDNVPPFSGTQSRGIVEKAFAQPIEDIFSQFETEPMASASVAQVHAATLKNGKDVVVKVLRPGIEKTIGRDIELMYILARLAARYWSEGKRLRPVEVVEEYEKTIFDELDLQREGANASQLRRNFEGSDLLYVPQVDWKYTTRNAMVMERIYGIPVSDVEALKAKKVNFRTLSERGVEVFFSQVFRDNFFHADMHPGNIFVDAANPETPKYIAVDFGIIGSLTESDQRYLAENFYAFFHRDYRRVAELHVESGWVPASTRVDEFESAIRTVCEPIFERPLKEISFGHFLLRLFQTARRFNMEVQPQLVLLQKTLLNIEGLGRDLYPDLDLWKTAKPFIENWMKDQMGISGLMKGIRVNLPKLLEKIPETPLLLHEAVQQITQGRVQIHERSEDISKLINTLEYGQKRTALWIVGGTLLVGAAVLINEPIAPLWLGASWLFWASLGAGLFAWGRALFGSIKP